MKFKSPLILIFIVFFLFSKEGIAQGSISGTISDRFNQPISNINVILQELNKGVGTAIDGSFIFSNIMPNTYTLVISGIGYTEQRKKITLNTAQNITVQIQLEEELTAIDEVTVLGKNTTTRIQEKSIAVNSISTKKLQNISTDVNQILNQTSGVRIKESGGLGAAYEFSLNGLSGRQIRFFVDDIPVDQLGDSFNFNNIPVNLVERIDVYKGVVPIHLGADALGGAVNIVTQKKTPSFLDVSYSIGSFNTHRAALNSKYRFKNSGLTVKANGFYNYSDNNYTMNDIAVFVAGEEQIQDIERFHDRYTAAMGNIGFGITQRPWADELMAHVAIAHITQEVQSGVFGTPVGEATEEERNTTYSLKYTKSGLFNGKLDTQLFALYNEIAQKSIDTSSNRYNWRGEIIRTENNNLGELVREKAIFDFTQSQRLYRANATYTITPSHRLHANYIHSNSKRQGENRLNTTDNEPFKSENTLEKKVTGLAYESHFFDDRLENTLSLKYFDFDILARDAVQFQQNQFEIEDITTSQQHIGYNISSRFFITQNWYIKASYEKGYRIPQPIEIFGDGLRVLANPMLTPESSHNINLGIHHQFTLGKGTLKQVLNVFQRDVSNFIFIQRSGVFSVHENVLNVLVKGLEWDVLYSRDQLTVNANVTWQNVLNNQRYIAGTTTPSSVYRDRMPNTPYFFANANINYNFGTLFSNITLQTYYAINYVHEYFLNYPSVAITSTKNSIPSQFLNHLGTTFSSKNSTYNLSLEVRNLFNAKAFDNFNLQKPGRSIHMKFRYFIN